MCQIEFHAVFRDNDTDDLSSLSDKLAQPFCLLPPLAASAEAQGGVELEEGAGVDGEDVAALAHMH